MVGANDRHRRRTVGARIVHAQAVDNRQGVIDLPGVLDEGADLGVLPGAAGVCQGHAIGQVVLDEGAVVAGSDFVGRGAIGVLVVEAVGTVQQLAEYVDGLVAHVIDAALDLVVAEVIGAGEGSGPALAADRVLVAEAVFTRDDPRRGGRDAGRVVAAWSGAEAREHFRLVEGRAVDVVVLLIADLQLGAEILGPVAEHLDGVVVRLARAGVPVGRQDDAPVLDVAAVRGRLAFFGLLVGEGGAMIFGDVPVDLGQGALVHERHVAGAAAVLDADAFESIGDGVDLRLGEQAGGGGVGADAGDAGHILFFVAEVEEQPVLHDRAAEGEAGRLVLVEDVEVGTFAVADHAAAVGVGVVHRAVEFVGTRLGDGVDVRADGVGADVEVGDRDVIRVDGVGRDRRTGEVARPLAFRPKGSVTDRPSTLMLL